MEGGRRECGRARAKGRREVGRAKRGRKGEVVPLLHAKFHPIGVRCRPWGTKNLKIAF